MVTERQRKARALFVRRFAGRKGKARPSKSRSQKRATTKTKRVNRMASVASYRRKARASIKKRYSGTIPLMDGLHGLYTLDGVSNGAVKKIGVELGNGIKAAMTGGNVDPYVDKTIQHASDGFKSAVGDPKRALMDGAKNFLILFGVRKVLELAGVPKSIKFIGSKRLQIR